MAGDPIYDCCDATCITSTTSTCYSAPIRFRVDSTTDTYYTRSYTQEKRVPKKTKKEMVKERAEKLHKLSFLMMNEVRPKVFQVIGYPMKNKPKAYHKNYALH
jgi:hypothetical protein